MKRLTNICGGKLVGPSAYARQNVCKTLVVLTFLLLEQRVLGRVEVCNKIQHVMCDSREQPSLSQPLKRYPKDIQNIASNQFCDSKIDG